jgi:DNA invertase Pin-like site-specific DNA recombinase
MLRAAIYLRALSDDPSCVQRPHVEELVQQRGWLIVDTFVDAASREMKLRPVVRHMLARAKAQRFDVLVVCSAARITRSTRELVSLTSELGELGVEFVSATEALLDTTTNETFVELVHALELHERTAYSDTLKRASARAKRKGLPPGRPPADFDLERARRMRRRGTTVRAIAKKLGVPKSVVQRYLVPKGSSEKTTKSKPAQPAPRPRSAKQSTFAFAAPP